MVSDQAGTTRDAIDEAFEQDGQHYVLVDTAGLRRPGRRQGTGERVGALMTVRALERAEVALIVVDAEEGLTDQDAHVARMVQDLGRAAVVVANKWDRLDSSTRAERKESIAHGLRFLADAPIVGLSALTGLGLRKLLPATTRVAAAAIRRIPTAELNRWLSDVVARNPPGRSKRGKGRAPIKFQYASQVSVSPPCFVLFCSDADGVTTAYQRFLENRLREQFDFEGTPIRLRLRSRERRGRED